MYKNARGMTITGLLLVSVVVIFIALMLTRILPNYFEFYEVKNALNFVANETRVSKTNKEQLYAAFAEQLHMNSVYSIKPDILFVDKTDTGIYVGVKYERRIHLIGNIDGVISFEERVLSSENNKND